MSILVLLSLLALVLLIGAVCWATQRLLSAFAVPDPLATVIFVVVVLACLVLFLSHIGLIPTGALRL